jgi:hypothetical protein
MPKRYRVVGGSGFTWEYIDETDPKKWVLLAESHERWPTQGEVEKEIKMMGGQNADIKLGRDGKGKPEMKNPRNDTGTKKPGD